MFSILLTENLGNTVFLAGVVTVADCEMVCSWPFFRDSFSSCSSISSTIFGSDGTFPLTSLISCKVIARRRSTGNVIDRVFSSTLNLAVPSFSFTSYGSFSSSL
uniref:Putative secreted peptide n=1 Tax=Anopheles braziliensis TaxID=58242 RepID=A0A2M3ZS56_9DIPT